METDPQKNIPKKKKKKRKGKSKRKRLKVYCPSCRFLVTLPAISCPECGADMRTGFGGEDTSKVSPFRLFSFAMRMVFTLLLVVVASREVYFTATDQEEARLMPKVKERISDEITNFGRMVLYSHRFKNEPSPPPKPNSAQVLTQEYPLLLRPDILMTELSRGMDKKTGAPAGPHQATSCMLPKTEDYGNPSALSPCQRAILLRS